MVCSATDVRQRLTNITGAEHHQAAAAWCSATDVRQRLTNITGAEHHQAAAA